MAQYHFLTRFLLCLLCLTWHMPHVVAAQETLLVEIDTVKKASLGAHHVLHCQVTSRFTHQVDSEASAKLIWALPVGSKVSKGQLIAEQDDYYLNRRLTQNDIAISQAKAELSFNQKELERLQALQGDNLVAETRLSALTLQKTNSQSQIEDLENQREELLYRQRHLKHYAPDVGEIVAASAQLGERLDEGDTILQLQKTKDKEVLCKLPHDLYIASNQLREATFELDSHSPLTLSRYSNQLQANDQSMNVYLLPEHITADALFFAQRLQANVYFQRQNISRIPHETLKQTANQMFVWKLNEQNRVSKVDVDILSTEDDFFLVHSLLQPNDKIVSLGKEKLVEGQQVRIVESTSYSTRGQQ